MTDHLNYKWPAVRVRRVVDEDDLTNKEVTYTFMLWGEPSKKCDPYPIVKVSPIPFLSKKLLLYYGQNRQAINRPVASVLFTKEKHHLNL